MSKPSRRKSTDRAGGTASAEDDTDARLCAVLEDSPLAVSITTMDGIRLWTNSALADMRGESVEGMIGGDSRAVFADPDDRAALMAQLQEHGRTRQREVEMIRADGTTYWALLSVSRIDFAGHKAKISWAYDITKRKVAEQHLIDSEQRFRRLIDTSSQGVMLHRDFKAVYVNRAFVDLYGYDDEQEILDLDSTRALIAPEFWDASRHQDLSDGKVENSTLEYVGVKKDGSRFWVQRQSFLIDWQGLPTVCSMRTDITERKQAEEVLRELAATDPLTGADNRRSFTEKAERELRRAVRYDRRVSLIAADIDHFKAINDGHGHPAGDQVLKRFVEVCRQVLREQDMLGRMGGEEFAVLLPEEDVEGARRVAERLRAEIEALVVDVGGGETVRLTASFGVAACGRDLDGALAAADKALYQSKTGGRNRVTVAPTA